MSVSRETSTHRAIIQRRYHRKNAAVLCEKARERDIANPAGRVARNTRFQDQNPNYWRDYWPRRKFRLAWIKFSTICAANRRALEAA
jgi:hypothetical protein